MDVLELWKARRECRFTLKHYLSPDLAYIIGVYMGDGYAYITGRSKVKGTEAIVGLDVKNVMFAEEFKRSLERLGLKPIVAKKSDGRISVYCYSLVLYNFLKSVDLDYIRKVIVSKPELFSNFVKGFYESEGSICRPRKETCKRRGVGWRTHVQLRMYNTNRKLLETIAKGLERYGIKARVYLVKRREQYKKKSHHDLYAVVVQGVKHVENFLNFIKPVIKNNPWGE